MSFTEFSPKGGDALGSILREAPTVTPSGFTTYFGMSREAMLAARAAKAEAAKTEASPRLLPGAVEDMHLVGEIAPEAADASAVTHLGGLALVDRRAS